MILNWVGWEEGGQFGCHKQICRDRHWAQGVQYVVVSEEEKQCNRQYCCGAEFVHHCGGRLECANQ